MNAFQQVCPSCDAVMELPIEAAGKIALCPACQTEFVANHPVSSARPKTQTVSIESVLGDTQSVISNRQSALFIPFLIPSVLVFFGVLLPLGWINGIAQVSLGRAVDWFTIFAPLFWILISYAIWFALVFGNTICDCHQPDKVNRLSSVWRRSVPKWSQLWRLMVLLLMAMATVSCVIAIATVMIRASNRIPTLEIRLVILVVSVVTSTVACMVIAMRLWPLFPMVVDQANSKPRDIKEAIRTSWEMTRKNLMTSFLLVITVTTIVGLGACLFGIGLPVAIPCAATGLVVGYRLIGAQRIPVMDADWTA